MKILVVDDAPFVLGALRDILEAYGHDVFEAVNGDVALDIYLKISPDVVIMDVLMPYLDGVSATKNILRHDPNAKIIVITAVGKAGLEKECMDAGAKGFLIKPFKNKDLLRAVGSVAKV